MKSSKDVFDPEFWERENITYEDLPTFQEMLKTVGLDDLARRVYELSICERACMIYPNELERASLVSALVQKLGSVMLSADVPKTVMIPHGFYKTSVHEWKVECRVEPGWIDFAEVAKVEDIVLNQPCLEECNHSSQLEFPGEEGREEAAIRIRDVGRFPHRDVLAARVCLDRRTCNPSFVEDFLAEVILVQFPGLLDKHLEYDEASEPYTRFGDEKKTAIKPDMTFLDSWRWGFDDHTEPSSLCKEAAAILNNDGRLEFLRRLNDLNRRLVINTG